MFKYIRSKRKYLKHRQLYADILQQYSAYFRQLSVDNKDLFLKRLSIFLVSTSFKSEKGFVITEEMKVLISSAFIQITFGLLKFTLKDYNSVFIAPSSYNYKFDPRIIDGDVNTKLKRVSLSWPSVLQGFEIPDDAINIAIHEFGHCLAIENFSKKFLGRFFSRSDWELLKSEGLRELIQTRTEQSKGLVTQTGPSNEKLFAAALEVFFEKPDFLEEHLPNLYNSLKTLLNQDPKNAEHPRANEIVA